MPKKIALYLIATSSLTGCSYGLGEKVTVTDLDASERVVFSNDKGQVCAEPSPDAVKSIAESVSAKVQEYGEISQSYASTMASIGLRTAGVQILRDIGYRACEAYINGGFNGARDDEGNKLKAGDLYKEIIEGADDAAVALVAVEGLTSIRPAPAVAISSSASGTTNDTGAPITSSVTQPATINFNAATGQPFTADQTQSIACAVVDIVRAVVNNYHDTGWPPSTCEKSSDK